MMHYNDRKQYQSALLDWLTTFEANFFVTANFNLPDLNCDRAKRMLKRFHAVIDRKLLGKHWAEADAQRRTRFVAMPETKAGKLHYHLLVNVPDPNHLLKFRIYGNSLFREAIAKAGSLDIQRINFQEGVAEYITKDSFNPLSIENYILSDEFLSADRK